MEVTNFNSSEAEKGSTADSPSADACAQAPASAATQPEEMRTPERTGEANDVISTPAFPPTEARRLSSAHRVFLIPELADSVAQYLRPVYISQLRLVSRPLYAACVPYLRLHLHRNSTASWTHFPPSLDATQSSAFSSPVKVLPMEPNALTSQVMVESGETRQTIATEPLASATTFVDKARTETRIKIRSGASSMKKLTTAAQLGYEPLVYAITADSMDNFDTLLPILRDCPNLQTLSVTRWSRDLQVFRQLLPVMLPRLQQLSVSFYNTVDLNVFLTTLTSTVSGATHEAEGEKTEAVTEPRTSAGETTSVAAVTKRATERASPIRDRMLEVGGLGSLKSLDIKHRVPDTNFMRWKVFKVALDKLQSLQHLSLTGIGFRAGKDTVNLAAPNPMNNTTAVAPLFPHGNGGNPAGPAAATPNENIVPEDDSQVDDDYDEEPRSLEDNPGLSRTYPNMRSLSLSFCECPVTTMLDLDRIFPKLTSLEVNKCRNTWLHVFERDPLNPSSHLGMSPSLASSTSSLSSNAAGDTSTSHPLGHTHVHGSNTDASAAATAHRVPFPDLTHLKLIDRYEGHEDLIYEIIRLRPHLISLETHQISLNIDTLLPMANFCMKEGRFLQKFALSPCWSNSTSRRDFERLYESSFLGKARHLYIQQELTEKMYFASSLTSLHIGAGFARDSVIEYDSVPVWNGILRRLPCLEILRIDRYIKDFLLFEGLGRSAAGEEEGSETCPVEEVGVTGNIKVTSATIFATTDEDWTQERPYLQELQITFRAACVIQVSDLDRELVQRFRFLERLCFSCSKPPVDLEARKATWRPGLVLEHRRYESK